MFWIKISVGYFRDECEGRYLPEGYSEWHTLKTEIVNAALTFACVDMINHSKESYWAVLVIGCVLCRAEVWSLTKATEQFFYLALRILFCRGLYL